MRRASLYRRILKLAKDNYIEEPLLVGGTPRDLYRKKIGQTDIDFLKKDEDITTNTADSFRLAIAFAESGSYPFNVFSDSHVSVYAEEHTVDFSSNFVSKDAVKYLNEEMNLYDENLYEVYSRDFTINTLHKKLLETTLLDPSGLAIKDIEDKRIRTIAPPEITFTDDKRRLWRAVRFAARFGYKIDSSIAEYVRGNRGSFAPSGKLGDKSPGKPISDQYISTIVGESLEYNPDITMGYILDFGMLSLVPLVGRYKDELIKNNLITKYLDGAANIGEYQLDKV
tara:strand:+ start:7672 stop:8520 length:849 start_codon:yes stop_codon:yes gene_type:complete